MVLDEAPRLTGGHTDFADTVSAVWENHVRDQRLMLVLTGSAVAVMEQMLGPQGGLHRRAGVERRMDPFPLADARAFQPDLSPDGVHQAYAACGGYPLHLTRWSARRSTDENLDELAFTPGGLLLRDAPDILSEDLDWRGGYERVLTAMAGGARRRSRSPAGPSNASTTPSTASGAPVTCAPCAPSARPAPPIPSTRSPTTTWRTGSRPPRRRRPDRGRPGPGRPTTHGGPLAVTLARSSSRPPATTPAVSLRGPLPPETVVGRWWKDETVEIDVLALAGDRPVLVGECRWQAEPLTAGTSATSAPGRPPPRPGRAGLRFAFWSRGGRGRAALAGHPEVRTFTPADIVSA